MTFGILIFPGAHGDKELKRVLEGVYGKKVKIIWNRETDLSGVDVLLFRADSPARVLPAPTHALRNLRLLIP